MSNFVLDQNTPLESAENIHGLFAVKKDGAAGAVGLSEVATETAKQVGGALKITGNALPALGTGNVYLEVLGGTAGKTLTYPNSAPITVAPYSIAKLFGEGSSNTWTKVDESPLPKGEDGKSGTDWAAQAYSNGAQVFHGNVLYELAPGQSAAAGDVPGISPKWKAKVGNRLNSSGGAMGYDSALEGSLDLDIPMPHLGQIWKGDGEIGSFWYYVRSDKFQLDKGDTVEVRSATENLNNPAIAVYDLETGRFIPEETVFYEDLNISETNSYTANRNVIVGVNYRSEPQVGDFKKHIKALYVKPSDIDNGESPKGVASMKSFNGLLKNSSNKAMPEVKLGNKGSFNGDGTLNYNAVEFQYTDPIFVKSGNTVTARMRFNGAQPIGSVMGAIFNPNLDPVGTLKTQRRIEPVNDTNYRYETVFTAEEDCYISVMSHTTNPNAPVLYVEVLADIPNFLAPEHIGENSQFGVASQLEFIDFKNNGGFSELPDNIFNIVGIIKPDGDTTAVYASRYTDFIEVRKGQTINADVAVGEFNPLNPSVLMFVFDNTKTVLMQRIFATGTGMQSASYTAEETVYVRINHFVNGYNFKQKVTISKPKLYQPYGEGGGKGGTGRYIPDVTRYNPIELIKLDFTTADPIPTAKGSYMRGTMTVTIDGHVHTFYVRLEVQGSSSAGYPEKNWTIELFTDSGMTTMVPFRLANLLPHDEYVFKANWIEPNHVCNIAANRLWEQMLQTRDSFPKRDTDHKLWTLQGAQATETGALGHVDGFPAVLYINDALYGIGCFNIGKKYQNYDLTKDDPNNTQFELGNQVDLTVLNGIELRNPKTSTPQVVAVLDRFKSLASLDISVPANRTLFKDGFVTGNIVDAYLLLDYLKLVDCISRNFHWMTYDGGNKWLNTPYDLDSWFKHANGSSIEPPTGRVWDNGLGVPENTAIFWRDKVGVVFQQEIRDRYAQLRNMGIFSADNIYGLCRDLSVKYTRDLYVQDAARWPDKSNWSINILKIADWVRSRTAYLDGVFGY